MLFHLPFSTLRSDQYSLSCCEITLKISRVLQWQNEYWLDHKVENRRWNSMQNCIVYTYIIMWYDRNSNTYLEPKVWIRKNEAVLYVEPNQTTASLCQVWVTTPPRQCELGIWTGLEPNATISLVQTQTADGLPWPVADTSDYRRVNDDLFSVGSVFISSLFGEAEPVWPHTWRDADSPGSSQHMRHF